MLSRILLGSSASFGFRGDGHVLLDDGAAPALGLAHVHERPASRFRVVLGVGASGLDVAFERLKVVGCGADGVVGVAASGILLGDFGLLQRRAFARGVGGLHPSEVLRGPSLVLLRGEHAALVEGGLVDDALGGGSPGVLLRAEPSLLLHELAHREQGVGPATRDAVHDDREVIARGVHLAQGSLSAGVLVGALLGLLLLERRRLGVPRLASLEFLRAPQLLLRGGGVHLALELGAACGFALLRGFDLGLSASFVGGGEIPPLILALHVGILLRAS